MPISENLRRVRGGIEQACARAGRDPSGVRLVAVSKLADCSQILAAAEAGQADFGENYLQKALPKIESCSGKGLRWHMIGRLQSNKAARVASAFDLVHSLDSRKVARALSKGSIAGGSTCEVLIQVKLGGGDARGGVPPEGVYDFAAEISTLPALGLRGVMGVAPLGEPARPSFARLRRAFEDLRAQPPPGARIEVLSAGMSQDFDDAILEGATMVRIGTAIFGRRR